MVITNTTVEFIHFTLILICMSSELMLLIMHRSSHVSKPLPERFDPSALEKSIQLISSLLLSQANCWELNKQQQTSHKIIIVFKAEDQ